MGKRTYPCFTLGSLNRLHLQLQVLALFAQALSLLATLGLGLGLGAEHVWSLLSFQSFI